MGALLQIADHASGKNYLPTYDTNGNLATVLNAATGDPAATYEYGPFGEILRATVSDSVMADNPWQFSTKFTDTETGLVYYGHRYYSPALGRFINRDPVEESGGVNLYGFALNDPIDKWDVLGNAPDWSSLSSGLSNLASAGSGFARIDGQQATMDSKVSKPPTSGGNGAKITTVDTSGPNKTTVETDGQKKPAEPQKTDRPAGWSFTYGKGVTPAAPNRTAIPNANDTLLGRANLLFAQAGGQTADNALNTATIAALGAQQGLRDHVGVSGDFALNILPIPRNGQFGPFPGGVGWGVSADANFKDGVTGNQNLTGGKFGASGSLGITFSIPFSGPGSGGQSVTEITFSGGAGPGGALKFGVDSHGNLTDVKITIGAGFGFEVSGSVPFPKK